MKQKFKLLTLIILFITSTTLHATETYIKQWTTANFVGSISEDSKFKYYIEPQLRFIDDRYVFNQAFLFAGLGYQFTPTVSLFVGPGWVLTKNTEGEVYHEYRLWQQLNWQILNSSVVSLNSRTRLEEKERSNQSQVAYQLRERIWVRIPIKNTNQFYYSVFDEVFFNLNHPSWTSPHFFEQNRLFLGIGKQLTKTTMLDFGYLNQLQFGPPRQLNHVLLVSFSVTN